MGFVATRGTTEDAGGANTYTLTPTAAKAAGNVWLLRTYGLKTGFTTDLTPSIDATDDRGLTWTKLAESKRSTANRDEVSIWVGVGTDSGLGVIRVNWGQTLSESHIHLEEWSLVDTASPSVQSKAGFITTPGNVNFTVTLDAPPTSEMVVGAAATKWPNSIVPGTASGWTESSSTLLTFAADGANNSALQGQYKESNDQSCEWTAPGTDQANTQWVGVVVELRAAAVAVEGATKLRTAVRARASGAHAVSSATKARVAVRERAAGAHAVSSASRQRVAVRSRSSGGKTLTGASKLRAAVRARASGAHAVSSATKARVAVPWLGPRWAVELEGARWATDRQQITARWRSALEGRRWDHRPPRKVS